MFLNINRSFLFGLALSLSPAAAGFLGVSFALGSAGGGGAVGPRTHDCPENRVGTRRDTWYARRGLEFAMYAIALKIAVWVLGAAAVVFLSFGAARLVAKESGNALRVGGGIDLGVIEPFATVSADILVRNESVDWVHIEDLITTCGCVKAAMAADSVGPAQAATLRIVADASKAGGERFSQTVFLIARSATGRREQHRIQVTGQIDRSGDLRATPGRLYVVVPEGGEVVRTIELRGSEAGVATLPAEIEYSGANIVVRGDNRDGAIGLAKRTMSVVCRPDAAAGELVKGEIKIILAGEREVASVLPITLEVVKPIAPSPAALFVALTERGATVEVPFALHSFDGSTVRVESIGGDAPVRWRRTDPDSDDVILTFANDEWPTGISRDVIRAWTSQGDVVEVRLVIVRSTVETVGADSGEQPTDQP